MSDAVIVAAIGAVASMVSVILAGRANHNAKKGREQVENDHSNNFREENDERHAETLRRFTHLDKAISGTHRDVRGLREDHSDLSDRVHELEKLEMTNPRPRKERS
jgi:hypothetical protein